MIVHLAIFSLNSLCTITLSARVGFFSGALLTTVPDVIRDGDGN